jgi:hypothetical protein
MFRQVSVGWAIKPSIGRVFSGLMAHDNYLISKAQALIPAEQIFVDLSCCQ